jgi:hypothetical protein
MKVCLAPGRLLIVRLQVSCTTGSFVLYHLFSRQTTAKINILYAYILAVVALALFALRLAAQINRLNTRYVLCLLVIIK